MVEFEEHAVDLQCPFCGRKKSAKFTDDFVVGRFFSRPISEATKTIKLKDSPSSRFLRTDLPCKCGASWYVGGGKIPKGYVAVRQSKEIVAVKPRVSINEVELKGKKKGRTYRWKQMQLRFPSAFETVKPGDYVVYHDGEDIVLKPVKGVWIGGDRSATP